MALENGPSGIMTTQPQPIPGAPVTTVPSSQSQSWYSNSDPSSPRQFPSSDLPDAILEEAVDESASDSAAEPVTPTSGRHSRDLTTLHSNTDVFDRQYLQHNEAVTPQKSVLVTTEVTPQPTATEDKVWRPTESVETPKAAEEESRPVPLSRRSTRGSTTSFKRTMSSLFRRSNSHATSTPPEFYESQVNGSARNPNASKVTSNPTSVNANGGPPPSRSSRRFSMNRSSTTTRSNTPPSPGSPLEIASTNPNRMSMHAVMDNSLPNESDFSQKKKNRSSTGLTLRGRTINFLAPSGKTTPRKEPRRANSFDSGKRGVSSSRQPKDTHDERTHPPERLPWAMPPDAGTGAKARRMSLSLPDDFTVDVADLQSEYEYQSKFGRHGKHLGKGAASKVTLMARKGCANELYAVKEFRGKSNQESKDDYDKKIKSEYSIAKSLHHPNIVETMRLCTDHARWNHVMEYCSEGDLFTMVQKGYLKSEDRKKDRLCLFKQLVQGVNYLHANGIAHRDIKLENLLVTKDSKLKITDFGVSEVFTGTHPGLREAGGQCGQNMGEVRLCSPGICGSEPYIAPEVLAKKTQYDPRSLDVWSSAIIMIYLTFGGAIWTRAEPGHDNYDKLVKGWNKWYEKHPECDACITDTDYPSYLPLDLGINPPALRRIVLQMLNPDPAKRIGIAEVANNRWLKNVECCQMETYEDAALIVDATKLDVSKNGPKKIFCHNHLPPKNHGPSFVRVPLEG